MQRNSLSMNAMAMALAQGTKNLFSAAALQRPRWMNHLGRRLFRRDYGYNKWAAREFNKIRPEVCDAWDSSGTYLETRQLRRQRDRLAKKLRESNPSSPAITQELRLIGG